MRTPRAALAALLAAGCSAAATLLPLGTAASEAETIPTPMRDVMFVGNNWAGTATIVDAHTRTCSSPAST